jgi:hypothetical protein
MPRREIYFDTQIFRDAADGVISDADWKRTTDHVARKFRHRISPVTLYELLSDIAAAQDSDFERMRDRIKRLFVAKKNRFLRLPRYFVTEHVFGDTRAIQGMEPDDFDVWSRVVLAAADKNTLLTGVSMKEDPRMKYRLDLQDIDTHLKEGEAEHGRASSKQDSTGGNTAQPETTEQRADSLLKLLWREPSDGDRHKLTSALSAAVAAQTSLASGQDAHQSWMRLLQLFYLADPELILVTSDAELLTALKNSPQADRVWDYDKVKRAAEVSE